MHIETGAVKRRLASKLLSSSAANPRLIPQTGEGYEWSSQGSPVPGCLAQASVWKSGFMSVRLWWRSSHSLAGLWCSVSGSAGIHRSALGASLPSLQPADFEESCGPPSRPVSSSMPVWEGSPCVTDPVVHLCPLSPAQEGPLSAGLRSHRPAARSAVQVNRASPIHTPSTFPSFSCQHPPSRQSASCAVVRFYTNSAGQNGSYYSK